MAESTECACGGLCKPIPTDFASTIFGRPSARMTRWIFAIDGNELHIASDVAERMQPGQEYSVLDGRYVVRRDGLRLHGRKLETFPKLSELE